MTAQTNAERQAALTERRKAAGLKQVRNLWAHPKDHKAIREAAAGLTKTAQCWKKVEAEK